MRRIHTLVAAALTVIVLLHALCGSFLLIGTSRRPMVFLSWLAAALLGLHVAFSLALTGQTWRSLRGRARRYIRLNRDFWLRRISGLAVLVLVVFHIGMFGVTEDETYFLLPFTAVKLAGHLLLIAAMAWHIAVNLKPLCLALGCSRPDWQSCSAKLVLLVFCGVAVLAGIVYFVRWQWI
ncbi:hypothetical protein [Megasphaera sp.]|uniref:hypothetical protein n=1 Tax=Megasphaera sp. TaxID=2023260 RepID=UPI00257C0B82|nr:hypothetical protein [Megasphaera sp.]